MKKFLLLLLLPTALMASSPLRLLDALQQATPGDYWVAAEGKNQTLLLIREREENFLVLDEITRPNRSRIGSWSHWIETGAPQHSSWVSHTLDLRLGRITQTYSHTHNQWVDNAPTNHFLSTLFTLPFQPMPTLHRRRIGPVTAADPMSRPLWQPRLTLEGQVLSGVPFSAWHARWPNDGSELAGKQLTIYIPEGAGNYPNYFPYWVEINDTPYTAKLRIIDSGRNLSTSPQTVSTSPFRPLFPSS